MRTDRIYLVASGGVDEAVVIRRRAQQRRSVGGRAVPVAEHLDRHHVIAFTLDGAGWRALTPPRCRRDPQGQSLPTV